MPTKYNKDAYTPKPSWTAKCRQCGKDYQTNMWNNFFCHSRCRSQYWSKKNSEANRKAASINAKYDLPTGTVGALAELMVSVDLLARGYEVFRAVSPACSVDLIANKNERTLRVEVKSARYNATGAICVPTVVKKNNGKFDVVAAVTHRDNRIHYIPPLTDPINIEYEAPPICLTETP